MGWVIHCDCGTSIRGNDEDEIVKTFYLSNADLKETIDVLCIVADARRISTITATQVDQAIERHHVLVVQLPLVFGFGIGIPGAGAGE